MSNCARETSTSRGPWFPVPTTTTVRATQTRVVSSPVALPQCVGQRCAYNSAAESGKVRLPELQVVHLLHCRQPSTCHHRGVHSSVVSSRPRSCIDLRKVTP